MDTTEMPAHIYFLLDRSGSMKHILTDVIGGFNQWLAQQKSQPGECSFTLVQFDSDGPFDMIHHAVGIAAVSELDDSTYVPRGLTPLLDAEGRLMAHAAERANDRIAYHLPPEAILVVTYTDGLENASTEWTFAQVATMKKEKEAAGWAFAYLGVGHDAYQQGAMVGTQRAATKAFRADARGVAESYQMVNQATDNFRANAGRGRTTNSADLYRPPDYDPAA